MALLTFQSVASHRLDQFLQERLPEYSRSRIQDWIKSGRVRVNGEPRKPSFELKGDEQIDVEPAHLVPLKAEAEEIPLDVLYEDSDVIAINKPAGMVVHAGAGVHSGTLVNAVLGRFGKLSQEGGDLRPGIVHRLDKDTSGVILIARTDFAHRALAEQFAGREVQKIYLALVHGSMETESGKIDKPISRDPVHRTRMTTRAKSGRDAFTEWKVEKRFSKHTLLRVRIGTGRTHQIRVHLASVKHPVVGDTLYGAQKSALDRFFLHAHRITFTSPTTQEKITVEAPLASELTTFLNHLE